MLSKRGAHILFIALFSGAMAAVVALAMTILHIGLDVSLVARWLRNTLLAWLVAFPSGLLLVGPLKRFADSCAR